MSRRFEAAIFLAMKAHPYAHSFSILRRRTHLSTRLLAGIIIGVAVKIESAPVRWDTGPGANNHWYEFINTPTSWTLANAAANASILNAPGDPLNGAVGHLVTITSGNENSFVDILVSGIGFPWIGLTDDVAFGGTEFGNTSGNPYPSVGNSPSDELGIQRGEGWVWITGEPLIYQNWNSSEPNNLSGENYGQQVIGVWNDLPNGSPQPYVVEYSIVPEPSSLCLLAVSALGICGRRHKHHYR
jgi:hypothetical protein